MLPRVNATPRLPHQHRPATVLRWASYRKRVDVIVLVRQQEEPLISTEVRDEVGRIVGGVLGLRYELHHLAIDLPARHLRGEPDVRKLLFQGSLVRFRQRARRDAIRDQERTIDALGNFCRLRQRGVHERRTSVVQHEAVSGA